MIKVSIIGTGQIGYDILHKLLQLDFVEIVVFVGRRQPTKKIPENITYSDKSIEYFILNPKCCNVVFDCTDSYSAIENYKIFSKQGIKVIDLTPSNIGEFYIPNIYLPISNNINMVTCGGQASIPFLHYIKCKINNIIYTEVVTQINSETAGMATRINIDKYIDTTELAIKKIVNIPNCKVILNINPSIYTKMQTTIFVKTENNDNITFEDLNIFIEKIQRYIKNYKITIPIWLSKNLLMTQITIISSGETLSEYAGNLDIINCAAISALKSIYKKNT